MKKYPQEHWKVLGEWVRGARAQAGYADTLKWSDAVGRSSRVLLGLERGEPTGAKTIEEIAEVLGITNWSLFGILEQGRADFQWTPVEVEEARKRYESETGLEADSGGAESPLFYYSDQDLLEELGRRLATRPLSRSERRLREVQQDWDDDTDLSDPGDELSAAAKEGVIEEPGEFNT